jgi:hypothetical protein
MRIFRAPMKLFTLLSFSLILSQIRCSPCAIHVKCLRYKPFNFWKAQSIVTYILLTIVDF